MGFTINLFPSPTFGDINIEHNIQNIMSIQIIDNLGNVIPVQMNQNDKFETIDVLKLPSGVYNLQFITQNKTYVKKFIKM